MYLLLALLAALGLAGTVAWFRGAQHQSDDHEDFGSVSSSWLAEHRSSQTDYRSR